MSDQKKWFKVWNSILTDPSFLDLPVEQIGRWTLLGSLISLHGENGKITLSKDSLYKLLRVQNDNGLVLPNVIFEEGKSDNAIITVIMKNWLKYQLDSTGYERLKKFRKSKMITVQDKTKIRLREDKEKNSPIAPQDFDLFWSSYPKKIGKHAAHRSWNKANNKPSIEKIISVLETQKKSDQWKKESGKYIPNPATWINDGRWDDEIKEESWVQKVESLL